MASPRKLEGKTAVVTGAASGLGKAITKNFLENGANVVLVDISDNVTSAADELSSLGPTLAVKADITKDESADKIFDEGAKKFGKVDILVNNAGIMDRFAPVGDQDIALWDRLMAINLRAPMLLSRVAVKHFLSQSEPNGAILNIASTAALAGMHSGVAYTTSKHAVLGLTKHTAAAYSKKGIRCNAILPGGMQTNIAAGIDFAKEIHHEGFQLQQSVTTNMQMVDVEQMAKLATHICSDDAKDLLNGALISADKGISAF